MANKDHGLRRQPLCSLAIRDSHFYQFRAGQIVGEFAVPLAVRRGQPGAQSGTGGSRLGLQRSANALACTQALHQHEQYNQDSGYGCGDQRIAMHHFRRVFPAFAEDVT
jgi:hypothetical protein